MSAAGDAVGASGGHLPSAPCEAAAFAKARRRLAGYVKDLTGRFEAGLLVLAAVLAAGGFLALGSRGRG